MKLHLGRSWVEDQVVKLICRLTPSCREVTRRLSDDLERPMPWWRRQQIRLHYTVCVWCERYGEQIRLIGRSVYKLPDEETSVRWKKIPKDAKARLREKLKDQR